MQNNFIFFGSSELSVAALEALVTNELVPRIVITSPDKPAGRKLEMSETKVSKWIKDFNLKREKNLEEEILLFKPNKLSEILESLKANIEGQKIAFALVASYGKILPQSILDLMPNKFFNIHPSDLPLYRGPSPIESQILDSVKSITISVMQMTKDMDAGNIFYRENFNLDLEKPGTNIDTLEHDIGYAGGFTFSKVIDRILKEELLGESQDASKATFTKKFSKQDGNVNAIMQKLCELYAKHNSLHLQGLQNKTIEEDIKNTLQKLYTHNIALNPWPGIYFDFKHPKSGKMLKVKISEMLINKENNSIQITKLTPEGKSIQTLQEFENGFGKLF